MKVTEVSDSLVRVSVPDVDDGNINRTEVTEVTITLVLNSITNDGIGSDWIQIITMEILKS